MSAALHSQRAAVLLAVGSSVAGVGMAVLAHAVGPHVDFRLIVIARALLALVIAWIVARRAGHALMVRAPAAMWVRSLLGAAIMVACFYAYTALPASDVVVILSTSPLFLALLGWLVLGHPLRPSVIAAVALGFAGVVLLERPHLATGGPALALALASALGISVVTLVIGRLRYVPSSLVVGHFVLVTVVVAAAMLPLPIGRPLADSMTGAMEQPWVWAGVAGVGVSGAIGQLLYTRACQMGRSTRVAVASVSQVPMTMAVDFILGTRGIDLASAVGLLLVVGPVVYLLMRPAESTHALVERLPEPPRRDGPTDEIDRVLRGAIERLERETSCELRIHVEPRGAPSEAFARALFAELSMSQTRRRNSLLLVVWLEGAAIAVVADEGVSDVVAWRSLRDAVRRAEGAGWPERVESVSRRLAVTLAASFPHPTDDTNELPDEISWGAL